MKAIFKWIIIFCKVLIILFSSFLISLANQYKVIEIFSREVNILKNKPFKTNMYFYVKDNYIYFLNIFSNEILIYNFQTLNELNIKISQYNLELSKISGIYVSSNNELIIYTTNKIYITDLKNKIINFKLIQLPNDIECSKIFNYENNHLSLYDYKNFCLFNVTLDLDNNIIKKINYKIENILFPWIMSDDKCCGMSLITLNQLCLYKYDIKNYDIYNPIDKLLINENNVISQFKFIGEDKKQNYYLRYFVGNIEKVIIISSNFKIVETINLPFNYANYRTHLLYDEYINDDGNLFTLFYENNKAIIKMLKKAE